MLGTAIVRALHSPVSAFLYADAKWRKIRTFKLVTGEVQGKTRADRLNAGLKQVRGIVVLPLPLSVYAHPQYLCLSEHGKCDPSRESLVRTEESGRREWRWRGGEGEWQ